jgi:hypothetical protein
MGRYAVSFFLGELVIVHVATFFLPDKGCGSISAHPTSFGVVLHLLFESAIPFFIEITDADDDA